VRLIMVTFLRNPIFASLNEPILSECLPIAPGVGESSEYNDSVPWNGLLKKK